jgi:hypothetical protein
MKETFYLKIFLIILNILNLNFLLWKMCQILNQNIMAKYLTKL